MRRESTKLAKLAREEKRQVGKKYVGCFGTCGFFVRHVELSSQFFQAR